jgi:hypothetical protein
LLPIEAWRATCGRQPSAHRDLLARWVALRTPRKKGQGGCVQVEAQVLQSKQEGSGK